MSVKLLKKLKVQEEKLLDSIYEFQELLDSADDGEISSMGSEFSELLIDFMHENDRVNLNDIRRFIEEEMG